MGTKKFLVVGIAISVVGAALFVVVYSGLICLPLLKFNFLGQWNLFSICGNWPVESRFESHPIGTTAGEYMVDARGVKFHEALDIRVNIPAPNGPRVLSMSAGTVRQIPLDDTCNNPIGCQVSLLTDIATARNENYDHIDYESITKLVRDGDVNFHQTLPAGSELGQVSPFPCKWYHLHFQISDQTGSYEPLLGLYPMASVNKLALLLRFMPNDDLNTRGIATLDPYMDEWTVKGMVDIVAQAHGRQPTGEKTGVLKIGYDIRRLGVLLTERDATHPLHSSTIDFSKLSMSEDSRRRARILFRDSSDDYCYDPPGEKFNYVLTNVRCEKGSKCNTRLDDPVDTNFSKHFAWDTTEYPNGNYMVTVTAWDFSTNTISKTELVKIVN